MDWNSAIEKNREALKRILVMLVAMLGGGEWRERRGTVYFLSAERQRRFRAGSSGKK